MTKIEWIKQLDNDELYDLINEGFETFPEEIKLDGPRKILNRKAIDHPKALKGLLARQKVNPEP